MGICFSARSKVDTSITTSTGTHSAESKTPNDGGKHLPASQTGSSSSGITINTESMPSTPNLEDQIRASSQLRKFTFSDLKAATRNFRPESVLGGGGFGYVFKGWIEENGTAPVKPGTGLTVAVKTLNPDGLQGHKEWLAEVNFLGQFHHPILVELIAYSLKIIRGYWYMNICQKEA
eukprot:TRINITY_DN25889_c0_g1_i2.p1 TRINITY_DN25889_c0_g1~~TRINITY_DN25889_c0_g1_i2.p1  ORF type:complete len:177 (-),score=28.09 TRINITY_DN25889_c0_g1_i2:75-605(-)